MFSKNFEGSVETGSCYIVLADSMCLMLSLIEHYTVLLPASISQVLELQPCAFMSVSEILYF